MMESTIQRETAILWTKRIIICTISLIILGIGCGINVVANQGADPITVFYDGLSHRTGLSVGMTAGILNTLLVTIVFFVKRKYINIGTVIYIFILGTFIDFGIWFYSQLGIPGEFLPQLIASLIGCVLCFIGLGGFIVADIGIDPWTAAAIILSKKINKPFKMVKITLDVLTLIFGWLMGGTVGIITIVCAVIGGPLIQKSSEILDKAFAKVLKSNCESNVKKV